MSPGVEAGPVRRASLWPAVVFAVVCAAPFLNLAAFVDDPYHLGIARRIVDRPWDPQGGDIPWGCGEAFGAVPHPPLWSYAEAAVGQWTDWNDFALHVLAAIPFAAFVAGFLRLAERVSDRPRFWTAVAACSPFILPGRNLMLDMPLLGFWVWAVELQMRAWFENDSKAAWKAGVVAGLAALTKYTALLLPILFFAGAVRFRKPKSLVALIPFTLLLGAWCLQNQIVHGKVHLLFHLGGAGAADSSKSDLADRVRILVRNAGSVFLFGPLLAAMVGACSRRAALFALAAAGGALAVGWADMRWAADALQKGAMVLSPLHAAHFVAFSANGALVAAMMPPAIWLVLRPAPGPQSTAKTGACEFVVAWLVFGTAFNLFGLSRIAFGAVRHMQSFLVPLLLLTASLVSGGPGRRVGLGVLRWICALTGAAIGFGLSAADLELANAHRRFALELGPLAEKTTTWYVGDPAVRYYAEKTAAKRFDPSRAVEPPNNPAAGELLAFPMMQWIGGADSPLLKDAMLLKLEPVADRVPLRTVDLQVNYYGGSRTSLPWSVPLATKPGGGIWPPAIAPADQLATFRLTR